MKAIEFSLNGKVVCQAGLPEVGNLAAILNLIAEPKASKTRKRWRSSISVGGLSVKNGNNNFLNFICRNITEKDCVQLRIVEVPTTSAPKSAWTETEVDRLKSKRRYLRQLKKELAKK